ncbi:helix-turn-helix domain-containing protein [Thermomonospora amylolytica]|uniref:helix-turn-helix domain-containing protein n=1 Tax=Thermomonospora amylolytica TaxID=1411117 RepID=UPI000E6D4962|nr:helix-turn-helix transcriptional regulator [Thermomonospora amylolytica]
MSTVHERSGMEVVSAAPGGGFLPEGRAAGPGTNAAGRRCPGLVGMPFPDCGADLASPHPWAAECRAAKAMLFLRAGRYWPLAVRLAEESLDDAPCRYVPLCVSRALTTLAFAGELVVADRVSLEIAEEASAASRYAVMDDVTLIRGQIARLYGDLAGAEELFATVLHSKAGPVTRLLAVGHAVESLVEGGAPGRARELLVEHDVDGAIRSRVPCRADLLAARGAVAMATGDAERALDDYLASGRELLAQRVTNPALLPWRRKAALAAKAAGRTFLAAVLARQEQAAAMRWGEPRAIGCALAAVALVDGKGREIDLLTEAAELLEVAAARVELGTVSYELGVRLVERGERAKGRRQLERARALFTRIGIEHRVEQVEHVLREAGMSPRGQTLTEQEAKIAKLAQAGMTNKQIAAHLYLALRTVEVHLSRVYRKLGISGREELRTAAL